MIDQDQIPDREDHHLHLNPKEQGDFITISGFKEEEVEQGQQRANLIKADFRRDKQTNNNPLTHSRFNKKRNNLADSKLRTSEYSLRHNQQRSNDKAHLGPNSFKFGNLQHSSDLRNRSGRNLHLSGDFNQSNQLSVGRDSHNQKLSQSKKSFRNKTKEEQIIKKAILNILKFAQEDGLDIKAEFLKFSVDSLRISLGKFFFIILHRLRVNPHFSLNVLANL